MGATLLTSCGGMPFTTTAIVGEQRAGNIHRITYFGSAPTSGDLRRYEGVQELNCAAIARARASRVAGVSAMTMKA